jgi:anti-sigma regulatory factor (Ser/Thr protein kinase)
MNRHTDPGTWHEGIGQGEAIQLVQPARGSGVKNRIDVEFEAGPTAAAGARNALQALDGRIDGRLLGDVRLLVSELVTNSVRHSEIHARAVVLMSVSVTESSLRVEVADPGCGFEPKPRAADRTRPGGWGLVLVDQLADRWGVARDHLTRVWFEMDHPRHGVAA